MLRSVWEAVGGYSPDLTYNEDWDFWIAALQSDISVAHVPRPLYFYRRHGNSMTATQPDGDRVTREMILKRHPAFFAVGDRKKVFRAGGFIAAAHAHRALGHRRQWAVLTARAISADPRLIYPETKAFVRTLGRKVKRTLNSIDINLSNDHSHRDNDESNLPPRNWESLALAIHDQYGYQSGDFSVLGHVIDKTGACSVLEIGCGSGRLVPVYLTHNVQTIWLQDVSERALDLCRQRFFCQKHIRYFHGNVKSMPMSTVPDLIVANRVLQHILDDDEFNGIMNYLASIARYLYINEAGIEEAKSINWPYLKGRDYTQICCDLGYHLTEQDELIAESGRQRWMLFAK
jgi:SAM-dependent methyltransferase